jgi:hypothetical protein
MQCTKPCRNFPFHNYEFHFKQYVVFRELPKTFTMSLHLIDDLYWVFQSIHMHKSKLWKNPIAKSLATKASLHGI